MPDSYDREGLIDRATDAINDGDPAKALEIADEIRKGEGPSADEALIRGIALSTLGRTAEASDAFAEATRRAPNSHKARFNAAVHEFNAGNVEGAQALADEALRIDPTHGGTRSLVEKIAAHGKPAPEGAVPPPVSAAPPSPAPKPWEPQAGDEEDPLPWIGKLGSRWIAIALIISSIGLLAFVTAMAIGLPISMAQQTQSPGQGLGEASQALSGTLGRIPAYRLASSVIYLAGIAGIFWTLLDLVRRRGNFVWLFAVIPLSCCWLGWLVLPVYLLFGRKS